MVPTKLLLQNFMCYRADLPPLDFDGIGVACLSGENGAGKSAILDAITWALWGAARLSSDDDLIALGETEMSVELIFDLDGQSYRVLRRRSKARKTGQSWLEFQVRSGETWRALTGASVRETQQSIVTTLRMDYELFANSAYLRQGRADEFTRKEPAKRKQVLADILALGVYEELEVKAKDRSKTFDGQVKVLEGRLAALRADADKRPEYLDLVERATLRRAESAATLANAEVLHAVASARAQTLEVQRERRDDAQLRLAQLRDEREKLEQRVVARREQRDRAQARLTERPAILEGVAQLAAARAAAQTLDGLRDAFDALGGRRRAHEHRIQDAESALRADLRLVDGELTRLRERAAGRGALIAERERATAERRGLDGIKREREQTIERRREIGERLTQAGKLQRTVMELQSQIEIARNHIASRRDAHKRQIDAATDGLRAEPQWRAELERANGEREQLSADELRLRDVRAEHQRLSERASVFQAELTQIKTQGDGIRAKLNTFNIDGNVCPVCHTELGADGVSHVRGEYERERQLLLSHHAETKKRAETAAVELSGVATTLAALERQTAGMAQLAAKIARLEGQLADAEALRARQTDEQRQHDALKLQLLQGSFESGTRTELSRAEAELSGVGSTDGLNREFKKLDARLAELDAGTAQIAELDARLGAIGRDLATLDAEQPALHEQELSATALRSQLDSAGFAAADRLALAALEAEIAALGYSKERLDAARVEVDGLAHWEQKQTFLSNAENWLSANIEALEGDEADLARRTADVAAHEAQIAALDADLRALAPAQRERDELVGRVALLRRELGVAERDLTERQTLLTRAEIAEADLLRHQAERAEVVERKGLFDELSQAFGKKGVQAMLIETAIPEIEREANVLLGAMTDNQMHLTFETQGATKKGEVTETLDIKIADALGTRAYDAYSGGEAFRLDFAIRIALAKLLARRAGARLETLIIDEGFGSQDARGRERLVEAITSVQSEFKRILVITHIQELKDMFPVQIEVTKTPSGSRWAFT